MDIFNRPPNISEDTLHYVLYPSTDLSDKVSATTLAAVIQFYVDSLLPDHLWHRDAFQLKVVANEDGAGYVVEGRMRVGDCVDDEWCAIWLLKEISAKWDVVISARDTDGEFLLIEAAEYLPDWVTPTNAENRVWIHHSQLHLIPLSHVSALSSKPRTHGRSSGAGDSDDEGGLGQSDNEDYVSVEDAVRAVRDASIDTAASQDIQNAIHGRIKGYPAATSQHVHHTNVYLPVDIAKALSVNPALMQKPVETFYTRDALQLRTAHRMARFPPQPSVLTTVKMTRTAYAQLQGQKFFPPKIFGRWQEPEGTPERRWRDVGMKLACGFEMLYQESKGRGTTTNPSADGVAAAAQARKDSLLRNDDYNKYVDNLKATGYFRNELEGSALWQQLEAKAIDAFLAARRDDDATRPSFASEFNIALSHPKDVAVVAREEDSDSWLDIDATDFDTMLETTMGPKTRQKKATMDVDEDVYATEEERVTQQQTSKLQEMAKKVEEFVEGKGDLDGARFQDEDISDDSNSDEDMESLDDESDEMDDGDSSASPESELLARKEAMEKLVPSLEPSGYGKMPSSYHINSQRVADPTVQPDDDEEAMDHNDAVVASPSTSSAKPEKRIRPPIIPRDQYDGVDSDDETDEEGEEYVDSDSEEEMPQVVGEVEIDMEEEQEEFLEFARHALGMSDEQWASIVQERRERGVFVPPTSGLRDENVDAARSDKGEPQQQHTSHPRPSPNPNLDSFEAVMEALDAEFGRLKPDKSKSREATSASDKGKGKATEAASDSEHDIEAAMDTELRGLIQGEDEDGGEDDVGSADYLDYGLIKNFLESFKSQSGLAGPVGNLVGRLQPDWTLPRDDS